MHNVCVFGHKTGDLHLPYEQVEGHIKSVLDILKFQYDSTLCLKVDGEIGVGQSVTKIAQELGIRYHIFLPCPIELLGGDWFEEQAKQLERDYKLAYSTTLLATELTDYSLKERDYHMIGACSFAICFWEGKKQGRTYDLINYALHTNKLILNGLQDLQLVTKKDTKRGSK
jgi:hypothetical protein